MCLSARREPQLQKAVADIEAAGGEAMYTKTDVTDPTAIKEMVAACVAKFGRLDILFVSVYVVLCPRFRHAELWSHYCLLHG